MAHPAAEALELLLEERQQLEAIVASPSNPHRMVREAKGLLMAADGAANSVIAEQLEVSRSTVLGWRSQFLEDGVGQNTPPNVDKPGDSGVTGKGKKGESITLTVTAPAGTKLYFMCLIHPWMQAELDVS